MDRLLCLLSCSLLTIFQLFFTHIYHQTVQGRGVTDELIWGSGLLLIDSWSDAASVVKYSVH